MSNWVVNRQALGRLAMILAKKEVNCEKLSRCLDLAEVVRGDGSDALTELLSKVARSASGFTLEHLEEIERLLEGAHKEDFIKLKIDLDLQEPTEPLLSPEELQELNRLAERASLAQLEEQALEAFRQRVSLKLRKEAAISNSAREQWRLWFKACARQDLKDKDEPWLLNLAQCAAEACEDEEFRKTFEQVRDSCRSTPDKWKLIEILRKSPPPPRADTPRHDVTAAPDRAGPIELPAGPPQAGYALVIGISKYAAQGPGSLNCAANDARQVSAYLQGRSDIGFSGERVRTLTDEEATLRGVLVGLDWLRSECVSSEVPDPLAIVYFSGHGMQDSAGRHFLVPHDGDKRQLFATALWNQTLNAALEQIHTRRLVVLLDACHAGGMVELPGAKDGTALGYHPDDECDGLRLDPGLGRYFIASCAARQQSFEVAENGIFTQSLLALLCFDGLEVEKLDLADLYRALRKRVDDAARKLPGGRSQTPTGNISEATTATGLILAINRQRASENRLKEFQQTVCKHLEDNPFPQKVTIKRRLTDFVERKERPAEVDPEFFELFTEGFQRWERGNPRAVAETCRDLANFMMGGPKAAPGAQQVRETSDFTSAAAPGPSASFATAGSTPPLPTSSASVVPAPAAAPRSPGAAIPMYQWRITPTGG